MSEFADVSSTRTRDYERIQLAGGWRGIVRRGPTVEPRDNAIQLWLRTLANDATKLPGHTTLKYSSSVEVIRADGPFVPGANGPIRSVVGKRAKSGGPFGGSRAKKNLERALRLMRAGIGTATPLALLENGRESWLVTEYLPGLIDLDQLALTTLPRMNVRESRRLKTRVIACVSNLLARLRDAGLHHRDLKASNILLSGINAADAECRPVILDLDGLRLWTLRQTAAERFRLTRLAASLLQYKSITCADYARFLRSYLRASQRTDNGWRWWFREISRRASNYNRKAQGRKPDKLDGYTG